MVNKAILLLIVLFLSGCATGYQKQGLTGGYTDMKIQDDIFKVGFKGNAKCSLERAEDFTLLRCAEVAIENGYAYFVVIDGKSGVRTSSYTTPLVAHTSGSSSGSVDVQIDNIRNGQAAGSGTYSGTYSENTYFTGGETYIFRKPSTTNTIKCFKQKPDGIPTTVYDAEKIRTNIRKYYGMK